MGKILGQKSKLDEQPPPAADPDPDPDPDKLLRSRIHFKLLSDAGSYERSVLDNTYLICHIAESNLV